MPPCRVICLLLACLLGLVSGASALSLFGNLSLEAASSASPAPGVRIQIGDSVTVTQLAVDRHWITWHIRAGALPVVVTVDGEDLVDTVAILPNLTTQLVLTKTGGNWELQQTGYLDQTGLLVSVSKEELAAMPGELADNIDLIAESGAGYGKYMWEGLALPDLSAREGKDFGNKSGPDLALISLSLSETSSGQADVNLLQTYEPDFQFSGQTLYGTRDQRLSRGHVRLPLPEKRGVLFGAVAYENTEDATPRSNIDYRLPHNGLDNLEAMGSVRVTEVGNFNPEAQFFYTSSGREYYNHDYYFDISHAPREESWFYSGEASVSGWLPKRVFLQAALGLRGENSVFGDGVYFDDLTSYGRPDGNPRYDVTGLYYFWDLPAAYDTLEPYVWSNADQSHVFEGFLREKTTGWNGSLSVSREFGQRTSATLNMLYSGDTYRRYQHHFPTLIGRDSAGQWVDWAFTDLERIGFDSLAQQDRGGDSYGGLPSPKQLLVGGSFRHIASKTTLTADIHRMIFNPGYRAARNSALPMDPDSLGFDGDSSNDGGYTTFEASDLKPASSRGYWNIGVGAGLQPSPAVRLFGHYRVSHTLPSYANLYPDFAFFRYKIITGGYFAPIPNPDLRAVKRTELAVGVAVDLKEISLGLQLSRRQWDNLVALANVPSAPNSYTAYRTVTREDGGFSDMPSANTATVVARRAGTRFLTGFLVGSWTDQVVIPYQLMNVMWGGQRAQPVTEYLLPDYSITANIRVNPRQSSWAKHSAAGRVLRRLTFDFLAHLRAGPRYTPTGTYNEVSLYEIYPPGSLSVVPSKRARGLVEFSAGLTARVLDMQSTKLQFRIEILNLFDRRNWLGVYTGTGLPDQTGWLETPDGQYFTGRFDTPDASGLTGFEKYQIKQNDPTNFGRPRIVRIMAELSF